MVYDASILFTLDTICPWTYLAKRRLEKAIDKVHTEHPDVRFAIKYMPYQLFDDAPEKGEPKWEWYKKYKYHDSEELMQKYALVMGQYGANEGIDFKFGGTVANTLDAHRVIQHFQEKKGTKVADDIVKSLYRQYFEEEQHPSSKETLLKACSEAGISESEAQPFIDDPDEGLMEVKMLIREQAQNGIDAVPNITFEGRKRDFTLEGAKDVNEYVKTMEQVVKESS